MIVPVEFAVNVRVFDPEISAQIENTRARRKQRLCEFSGNTVRQSQKNNGRVLRDLFRVRVGKLQRRGSFVMSKAGENFGDRFPRELPGRRNCKIDIRMRQQKPHQLLAGITGSADHRDLCLCRCHNAQCVFRLTLIAIGIVSKLGVALHPAKRLHFHP